MTDPDERASFTKAELAWCSYREAICDWDLSDDDGSMRGQLSSQCRKERNESQTKVLTEWVECAEKGCGNPPLFFRMDKQ